MPRPLRQDLEPGLHHIYARGNGRQAIFLDDRDRRRYLLTLGRVIAWSRWKCLSYCLMTNHVHLLCETQSRGLARGMQRLHGSYAQSFNRRHGRWGHLFEGRYGAVRIEDDQQLWATVGYIAHNPVSAGMVQTADAWPWSSHAAVIAGSPPDWLDLPRLFSYLAGHGGAPESRYAELILARAST